MPETPKSFTLGDLLKSRTGQNPEIDKSEPVKTVGNENESSVHKPPVSEQPNIQEQMKKDHETQLDQKQQEVIDLLHRGRTKEAYPLIDKYKIPVGNEKVRRALVDCFEYFIQKGFFGPAENLVKKFNIHNLELIPAILDTLNSVRDKEAQIFRQTELFNSFSKDYILHLISEGSFDRLYQFVDKNGIPKDDKFLDNCYNKILDYLDNAGVIEFKTLDEIALISKKLNLFEDITNFIKKDEFLSTKINKLVLDLASNSKFDQIALLLKLIPIELNSNEITVGIKHQAIKHILGKKPVSLNYRTYFYGQYKDQNQEIIKLFNITDEDIAPILAPIIEQLEKLGKEELELIKIENKEREKNENHARVTIDNLLERYDNNENHIIYEILNKLYQITADSPELNGIFIQSLGDSITLLMSERELASTAADDYDYYDYYVDAKKIIFSDGEYKLIGDKVADVSKCTIIMTENTHGRSSDENKFEIDYDYYKDEDIDQKIHKSFNIYINDENKKILPELSKALNELYDNLLVLKGLESEKLVYLNI